MELMDEETRKQVKVALEAMTEPVHLIVFTSEIGCQSCNETVSIVKEVSNLGDKLTFETRDMVKESELAERYGIDKAPALLVMKGTEDDHKYLGIRFFGIPAGYEFTSLLDAVLTVSSGEDGISEEGREFLNGLEKDVHVQVFVTPSCPYCPRAVILGHHIALVSDRVISDMVEASEFPEMAQKYNVMGVPRTVINEEHHQEGAAPEKMIIQLIKNAVS
ncbi:MAG: thioredoxin family protein [Candidatus Thermoplasmatota archaeon]|nr:thioredoxin family protein [Candidatus Thermoplasmatota archaeon]